MIEVRLQLYDAIELNLVAQLQQVLEQKRAQTFAVPPVPLGEDIPPAAPISDIEIARAITTYAQKNGLEKGRELLTEFGVKKVIDLPPEQRAAFVAKATA